MLPSLTEGWFKVKVRDHIIQGGIFLAWLYPVLGAKCPAFWASSVLIDEDHYFHAAGCMLSVYLLSLWLGSPWLEALFCGMVFHVLLDTVHLYSLGVPFKRAFSIIEFKIRKEIMKRNGLRPWVLYKKAADFTDR